MFQRILIAWDGSRVALRALDVALDVARRYDAELVAASVAYSPAHAETEEDRAESALAARQHLEETFDGVRDRAERIGVPLEHVIIDGDHPAQDLLGYVHEHAFDLVVAGHHRSSRAGRLLLHGVPERLVSAAEVPVLIVSDQNGGERGL
jgi:nucleotide-binding universal stress UspA family protein